MGVQNAICLDSGHRSIVFGTPEYRCHGIWCVCACASVLWQYNQEFKPVVGLSRFGGDQKFGPREDGFPFLVQSNTGRGLASVASKTWKYRVLFGGNGIAPIV